MNENDILGFDPSQLSVFAPQEPKSGNGGNPLIYHTRPADSKSEDGVYRSTIKVIYSPQDMKHSILEQQSYAMTDKDGFFSVVSSLTNNDTSCPIFKAWKKCHFTKKEENPVLYNQAETKDKGGKGLFDKRYARYVTIQVLSDKNQPELEGKYMFFKLPKSIWDIINAKMNPAKESGKSPIPVMDFLFGRAIDLEVKPGPGNKGDVSYTRETAYLAELSEDVVSCTNPDGSSLLNDAEQTVLNKYVEAMKPVWREKDATTRANLLAAVNADPNTVQLRQIYAKVLETIKGFCPDLNAELGYKPWDEATTRRVQAWIDIVLAGNDPAAGANVPEAAATVGTTTNTTTAMPQATTNANPFETSTATAEEVSDLPF